MVKPWLAYSLIRVGVFALAFAILMLVGVQWWLSAIIAAIIGLCVAYIFFGKLRDAVALDIATRRAAPAGDADTRVEDGAVEDSQENWPPATPALPPRG